MATLKDLLKTAFMPVGKTMYIYGGGWNYNDTAAGISTMTKGLNPLWHNFFSKQNKNYNFRNYNYKKDFSLTYNGLDCSAYIGWVIYNIFGDKYSKNGYVYKSTQVATKLQKIGLGKVTKKENIKKFVSGSILSSSVKEYNHVWLCVGQCTDSSVVLLHSSPPGVMLSGTYTKNGEKNSDAIMLAEQYMKKYYSDWFKLYPKISRDESYLKCYDMFEWHDNILCDNENYKNLTADKILTDLFKEGELYD